LPSAVRALHARSTASDFTKYTIALGAWRLDRLVPGDEVAFRIAFATVELAALLGAALHYLALLALGAIYTNACEQRLGVAAIRESATGHELTEAAKLDHHRASALLTDLIGRLVADLHLLHCLLGVLERGGERSVELLQRGHPLTLAVGDVVELGFHLRGEAHIKDIREVL